ncbi:hypothetical protein RI367_002305 [Sorochytrium milnesiophthora]
MNITALLSTSPTSASPLTATGVQDNPYRPRAPVPSHLVWTPPRTPASTHAPPLPPRPSLPARHRSHNNNQQHAQYAPPQPPPVPPRPSLVPRLVQPLVSPLSSPPPPLPPRPNLHYMPADVCMDERMDDDDDDDDRDEDNHSRDPMDHLGAYAIPSDSNNAPPAMNRHLYRHAHNQQQLLQQANFVDIDLSDLPPGVTYNPSATQKPFRCAFCGRSFWRKFDCKRHMRTHTQEKPFQCIKCTRGFARKDALNRHLQANIRCRRAHDENITATLASSVANTPGGANTDNASSPYLMDDQHYDHNGDGDAEMADTAPLIPSLSSYDSYQQQQQQQQQQSWQRLKSVEAADPYALRSPAASSTSFLVSPLAFSVRSAPSPSPQYVPNMSSGKQQQQQQGSHSYESLVAAQQLQSLSVTTPVATPMSVASNPSPVPLHRRFNPYHTTAAAQQPALKRPRPAPSPPAAPPQYHQAPTTNPLASLVSAAEEEPASSSPALITLPPFASLILPPSNTDRQQHMHHSAISHASAQELRTPFEQVPSPPRAPQPIPQLPIAYAPQPDPPKVAPKPSRPSKPHSTPIPFPVQISPVMNGPAYGVALPMLLAHDRMDDPDSPKPQPPAVRPRPASLRSVSSRLSTTSVQSDSAVRQQHIADQFPRSPDLRRPHAHAHGYNALPDEDTWPKESHRNQVSNKRPSSWAQASMDHQQHLLHYAAATPLSGAHRHVHHSHVYSGVSSTVNAAPPAVTRHQSGVQSSHSPLRQPPSTPTTGKAPQSLPPPPYSNGLSMRSMI